MTFRLYFIINCTSQLLSRWHMRHIVSAPLEASTGFTCGQSFSLNLSDIEMLHHVSFSSHDISSSLVIISR